MTTDTTSQTFFDAKYQSDADPWQFASSSYEQSRYAAIIRNLVHSRYQAAFEPGCSIGVLTEQLASLCDSLQASDISPTAVRRARMRCKRLTNVRITCAALPEVLPAGSFDLIVFSEIGYYLNEPQLGALGKTLAARLRAGGTLLASHWLGKSQDHVLTGDRVHELLGVVDGLVHEHSERDKNFRLDRWKRA